MSDSNPFPASFFRTRICLVGVASLAILIGLCPPEPAPVFGQETIAEQKDAAAENQQSNSPGTRRPDVDPDESFVTERPDDPNLTTDSPETWYEITPPVAADIPGTSVRMPAVPRKAENTFTVVGDNPMTVHLYITSAHENTTSLVFSYHDVELQLTTKRSIDRTLDGAVRGSIANVLGVLEDVKDHRRIRLGQRFGREFEYSAFLNEKPIKIASRIYMVNQRLYSMAVIMDEEKYDLEYCRGFFDSFSVTEPEPAVDAVLIPDSDTGGSSADGTGTGLPRMDLPGEGTPAGLPQMELPSMELPEMAAPDEATDIPAIELPDENSAEGSGG